MRLPGRPSPREHEAHEPCCDDCAQSGTRCDDEPARVGGWNARRRARAQSKTGGQTSVQMARVGAVFGGAAASSSVPVSEGGSYHRPEASRRPRGELSRTTSSSTRDGSPSWNERRRARARVGQSSDDVVVEDLDLDVEDSTPEGIAHRAVAVLPNTVGAEILISAWATMRARSRAELERVALELGLLGHPELAGALYDNAPNSTAPRRSSSLSRRRPTSERHDRSSSSSSSWNDRRRARRIGQVLETDSGVQGAVSSLDRDWNALATAVCGSARALLTCDTPAARALGHAWVTEFLGTIGDWRTFRDDFRQRWFTWALDANAEIDGWRAELERFRGDVARVTGQTPTATPQAPTPSPLDALGRGGERLATTVLQPLGFALAALAVLFGLSFLRR